MCTILVLFYKLKVKNIENVPEGRYIVAANHTCYFDPFLVSMIIKRPIAYMAKKELFEKNFFASFALDELAAFAVNREHLGASTIKTVKAMKDTGWVLGLFPQGKRCEPGEIRDVTKGFVNLARLTKCDILPVGIVGTNEFKFLPFSGQIVVKIGRPISYEGDADEIVKKWIMAIEDLTGFKYVES